MSRAAWAVLLAVAGTIAAVVVASWADALASGRPVLYGEGAVANAALLMRDGNPYADTSGAVAANYPPLYIALAALGDPFRAGRAVTIVSTLVVTLLLWRRSRGAPPVARAAVGLAWVALAPVAIWGAAVKPDMLAVAFTLAGVAALERATRGRLVRSLGDDAAALAAGALLALAVWAKPTALLPALAVLAFAAVAWRPAFVRAVLGTSVVAAVALAHAASFGIGDVWLHVVVWNALPWSVEQALLLVVVAAGSQGILLAVVARMGAFRGIALAYLLGAAGTAVLGGREGATINYLLDLAAATMFAAAAVMPRVAKVPALPAGLAVQLVIGFVLLAPFGSVPGRDPGTGAWGARERMDVVRSLPRDRKHLVEDSGLLVAAGMTPVIDDLFLWSRLLARAEIGPALATGLVGAGEYATVISEFDLERYEEAAPYQRARWHPLLVREILTRYELDPLVADVLRAGGRPVLWVYRPR